MNHWASPWHRDELPGLGPRNRPLLSEVYPDTDVCQVLPCDPGPVRVVLHLPHPPAQLIHDWRFVPLAQGVPVQLGDYRAGLRRCYALLCDTLSVTVSLGDTYRVPCGLDYRRYLAEVLQDVQSGAALLDLAVCARVVTWPAVKVLSFVKAYRAALRNVDGRDLVQVLGAVESVASVEDCHRVQL